MAIFILSIPKLGKKGAHEIMRFSGYLMPESGGREESGVRRQERAGKRGEKSPSTNSGQAGKGSKARKAGREE